MKHAIIIPFLLLLALNTSVRAETPSPHAEEKIEITGDASTMEPNAAARPSSPKITLVLGGGGCKALAEIGVLKVFIKNQIPIHYIVGTSAGAIIGSLYAAGVPLDDIEKMAYDGTLQRASSPHVAFRVMSIPLSKLIGIARTKRCAGLTTGSKLEKFLRKRLPSDFSDLKIPFAAVATDLESGNTCMITSGDLCNAVLASSAVPLLIRPVVIDDKIFIDGGIKANLPTNCAQLTGCDLIIAIPADAPIRNESRKKFRTLAAVAGRVTDIMEAEIDKYRWKEADIVIYPKVADTPAMTTDPEIIRQTIVHGEEAATEALPRLKLLLHTKVTQSPASF